MSNSETTNNEVNCPLPTDPTHTENRVRGARLLHAPSSFTIARTGLVGAARAAFYGGFYSFNILTPWLRTSRDSTIHGLSGNRWSESRPVSSCWLSANCLYGCSPTGTLALRSYQTYARLRTVSELVFHIFQNSCRIRLRIHSSVSRGLFSYLANPKCPHHPFSFCFNFSLGLLWTVGEQSPLAR